MKQNTLVKGAEHALHGLLLLIPFLPLLVADQFLFPFIFPKALALRLLVQILVLLYVIVALHNPQYRPRINRITVALGAFIGALGLSALFGIHWYQSVWSTIERSEGLITWLHLFGYFFILTHTLRDKESYIQLFKAMVLASWLQALYAAGQMFNLPFALDSGGERIGGSLGNASFLGTYLIIIIFISLFLLARSSSKKTQIFYGLTILANSILLWNTQTRGALLGLFIGMIVFLGYMILKRGKKQAALLATLGIMLLILSGGLLLANKNAPWVEQSTTLRRIVNISPNDITTQNRIIVWNAGFQAFLERPIFGWGVDNFNFAFNAHFDPSITRDVGSNPWYDRAHNMIIELLATTGAIGLLAYLWVAWVVAQSLKQAYRSKKISYTDKAILVSLFIAYIIQNLFVFDTISSYILILTIIGYATATSNKIHAPKARPFTQSLVTIITIALLVPITYCSVVRPALASHYTVKAVVNHRDYPLAMADDFTTALSYSHPANKELRFIIIQHTREQISKFGFTDETLPLLELALREGHNNIAASPRSVQNYILLSELYLQSAARNPDYLQQAEQIALASLEHAPDRYQVYSVLGRIYMSQERFDDGIEQFKKAIALNEQFAETWWNLGIAYTLSKHHSEAEPAFQKAAELGYDIYTERNITLRFQALQDSQDLDAAIAFITDIANRFPENETYQELKNSLTNLRANALQAQ